MKKEKKTIEGGKWKLFDIIARVEGLPLQGGKVWLPPEYSKCSKYVKKRIFEEHIAREKRVRLCDVEVIAFEPVKPTKREKKHLYSIMSQ